MRSPWHSCDARPRSSFTCKSAGPVYDSENMGEGHEADKDMRRTPGIAAAVMAALLAGYAPFAADAASPPPVGASMTPAKDAAMQSLLDYMRGQKTTGFLVMRGGRTLAEENWPAPDDRMFAIFLDRKSTRLNSSP